MNKSGKRIFITSPHMCGEELKYVHEAFDTNWIAPLGKNVDEFEKEIAKVVGKKYGAALISGTSAIHLALKWLGVGEGDVVFCSSLTFSGSCNGILYERATPVFIDSEYNTLNMCPVALEKALAEYQSRGKLPKAVIIVDLYGQSADFDKLLPICQKYNVPVIEDAAEALGATYQGKPCGSFGYISIISFNGNKIITTSGGGMLLCDDLDVIDKVRYWATQSRDTALHYQHSEVGYNYRLSNISAGIGRGQLKALDLRVSQKRHIYNKYCEGFAKLKNISMFQEFAKGTSNFWLNVGIIRPESALTPKDVVHMLEKAHIGSRPVWKPMHMQPVFASCEFFTASEGQPISEFVFEHGICLPSDTNMSDESQDEIIELIQKYVG